MIFRRRLFPFDHWHSATGRLSLYSSPVHWEVSVAAGLFSFMRFAHFSSFCVRVIFSALPDRVRLCAGRVSSPLGHTVGLQFSLGFLAGRSRQHCVCSGSRRGAPGALRSREPHLNPTAGGCLGEKLPTTLKEAPPLFLFFIPHVEVFRRTERKHCDTHRAGI